MGISKRRPLNPNAFVINGSNLERLNLFNKLTKILIIDPTVTGPSTILNSTQKENMSVSTADHLSVVAENFLNSSWTSAGWNVSSLENLNNSLDTWATNNLSGDQNIVRMQGTVAGSDYTICFCYAGNQDAFYLFDNFNRSNYTGTTPSYGGNWTCIKHQDDTTGGMDFGGVNGWFGIVSNQGESYDGGNGRRFLVGSYSGDKYAGDFYFKCKLRMLFGNYGTASATHADFGVVFGCNSQAAYNSGVAVFVQGTNQVSHAGSYSGYTDASIVVSTGGYKGSGGYGSGTRVNTYSVWSDQYDTLSSSSMCYFEVRKIGATVYYRLYKTSDSAPAYQSYSYAYSFPANYLGLVTCHYSGNGETGRSHYIDIDDVLFQAI